MIKALKQSLTYLLQCGTCSQQVPLIVPATLPWANDLSPGETVFNATSDYTDVALAMKQY